MKGQTRWTPATSPPLLSPGPIATLLVQDMRFQEFWREHEAQISDPSEATAFPRLQGCKGASHD
eukprot:9481637-Pyramimonas_sp.AAC.1